LFMNNVKQVLELGLLFGVIYGVSLFLVTSYGELGKCYGIETGGKCFGLKNYCGSEHFIRYKTGCFGYEHGIRCIGITLNSCTLVGP
jgi:hypothetical protein